MGDFRLRRSWLRRAVTAFLLCCAFRVGAQCTLTNVGLVPLPEMGPRTYKGYTGGLYPGGRNNRPPAHLAAGLRIAIEGIRPLNASGNVDTNNGKIVLISVGMSNTTHEFGSGDRDTHDFRQAFKFRADNDRSRNPQLVIVDGAQGGQDVTRWTNIAAPTWSTVRQRLNQAGVSTQQVQAAWVKQSLQDITQYGGFPEATLELQKDLEIVVRNLKVLFPNIQMAFVSSRTRCYTTNSLATNPEPYSWEVGFATKWMIERQIQGAPDLNFDPAKGPVVAPYLCWGPYLWADGTVGRNDGLVWLCSDVVSDFTHPSSNGVHKVADQLLSFFKTDPTTTPWFLRKTVIGSPPTCAPTADVTIGVVPLVHFQANASITGGTNTPFAWTFGDGESSTNANPVKVFSAPETYAVHLTVTDNNGNTAQDGITINAGSCQLGSLSYSGTQFQFMVNGEPNWNYVVQFSMDLTNWIPLRTNRGPFLFIDPNVGVSLWRFYRVASYP